MLKNKLEWGSSLGSPFLYKKGVSRVKMGSFFIYEAFHSQLQWKPEASPASPPPIHTLLPPLPLGLRVIPHLPQALMMHKKLSFSLLMDAHFSLSHPSWWLWSFSCIVGHPLVLLLPIACLYPLSSVLSCTFPLSQSSQALMESLQHTHLHAWIFL